jgi:hypothetical protein
MQGNCSAAPSAVALGLSGPVLLARKPGQCVVVTDTPLTLVEQNLWMDNLYIRQKTTNNTGTTHPQLVGCYRYVCNLWLTSVTFQGDSSAFPSHGGVIVSGGQLYAEGAAAASCADEVTKKREKKRLTLKSSGSFCA